MRQIFVLFLSLFFLVNCAVPRCKGKQCTVRLVHYHDGYEYRGVSLFEWYFMYKNPRAGEGYKTIKQDPSVKKP